MKLIETNKLKIGDWILEESVDLKGEFKIAKVKGFHMEKWQEFDLDKGKIKDLGNNRNGEGVIEKGDGVVRVLNKKEIKQVNILRKKLLMLNNLEDENTINKI